MKLKSGQFKVGENEGSDADIIFCKDATMEQHAFFTFSFTIEGAAEKVLQFIMPLQSSYNKKFGFIEQKCSFVNHRKVKTRKNLLTFFVTKKIVLWPVL